jgi:hypothetical protein
VRKPRTVRPESTDVATRARWLLAFTARDVSSLSLGELLDAGADAGRHLLDSAKVAPHGDDEADAMVFLKDIKEARLRGGDDGRPAFIETTSRTLDHITEADIWMPSRPFLQRLQETVRSGLRTLDDGKDWAAPFEGRWIVQPQPDGTLRDAYEGSLLAVLLASAKDLLVQTWPQIRRCARRGCGKHFLPKAKGRPQEYHDQQCATLARPKRERDYQEEYAKRVSPAKPRHRTKTKRSK